MLEPPTPRSSDSGSTEGIFLAWFAEHERGGAPSFADLCARHPEHALQLARLREAHERAEGVLQRLVRARDATGDDAPNPTTVAPPRYEIKGEIARGGMGTILEVYDPSLRRTVAMKVLRRDRADLGPRSVPELARRQSRLLSEAQILAQLDHPGVVAIHEMGLDEHGRAYFTMKRVRGQEFGAVIRAHHAGDPEWKLGRLVDVLVRVCEAVAYAHQKGVIHRDLKPSNVLVGRFGEVFVMDWGLAKTVGRSESLPMPLVRGAIARADTAPNDSASVSASSTAPLSLVHTDREVDPSSSESSPLATLAGEVVGTPAYMPPEQARGDLASIDARSDVYAVGAMLYHALRGEHPYAEAEPKGAVTVLAHVLSGPPRALDRALNAPEELVAITERAMARDPTQRYASILDLAAELRAFQEGRVVRAHKTGALVELRKWVRRNRGAAAAIGVTLVASIAVAVVQSVLKRDIELAQTETAARAEALRRQDYFQSIALAASAMQDGKSGLARELLGRTPADLRGFEWDFLDLRVDPADLVIRCGTDRNRSAVFSPDGASVVSSGSANGAGPSFRVFDARFGRLVRTLDPEREGWTGAASFSPDGAHFLLVGNGPTVQYFETRSWTEVARLPTRIPDVWPSGAWSPRGDLCFVGARRFVELWRPGKQELVGKIDVGQSHAVAWSFDGTRLYFGLFDGRLEEWDVETRSLLRSVPAANERVVGLTASPDGQWLAATWGRRVSIWDTVDLVIVHRTPVLDSGTIAMAWSPDSRWLACSNGANVEMLRAPTWNLEGRLGGNQDNIGTLAFDPTGRRLVSAAFDGAVRVFDLDCTDLWSAPMSARFSTLPVRYSADGRWLAVVQQSASNIEIWSTRDLAMRRSFHVEDMQSFDLSPDARHVLLRSRIGPLRILDAWSGELTAKLEVVPHDFGERSHDCARFSPDGARVSSVGRDGTVSVFESRTGRQAWSVRAYSGPGLWPTPLRDGCWSPDGQRLVTLTCDGRAQIWSATDGALLREIRTRQPRPEHAALSSDGLRLFVAGEFEQGLECWDLGSGDCVWTIQPERALALIVGDGDRRLFSVSLRGSLDIRDAATGQWIVSLEIDPLMDVGFGLAPTGDSMATASADGLRIWRTAPHGAARRFVR